MKILFIQPYPIEGPSSRYRVEQYIPYLRDQGIDCLVRPFISSEFYNILYKKGFYSEKILFFLLSSVKRFLDIFTALKSDIIFIHLEAFPFGPPVFEWALVKLGKKVIYDLDDAIYLRRTSPINKFLKLLKCPSKVKAIIEFSRHIITCNEYLAEYARKFNKNVTVIHTSVDTDKFVPRLKDSKQEITLGWIGSHSTSPYLNELKSVFSKLSRRCRFNLKIIGAGNFSLKIPNIQVMNLDWHLEDEIKQFQSLDIGLYPLPEDEWTFGKTGFKTIQYMSVGIPCVVSRVGPNIGIVEDAVNGFLAKTTDEWVEKLSDLIENAELRRRIGSAGRETVLRKFSLMVNAPVYLKVIKKVYDN